MTHATRASRPTEERVPPGGELIHHRYADRRREHPDRHRGDPGGGDAGHPGGLVRGAVQPGDGRAVDQHCAELEPGEQGGREGRMGRSIQRRIVGFHQDAEGQWVAELECGHGQHVRHQPPWQVREWVTTPAGRQSWLGRTLECPWCDQSPKSATGAGG